MKDFLNAEYLSAMGADLIIERPTSGKTYVCTLDRSKYNPSGAPIEEQPIWQIKCVSETSDSSGRQTQILYPNGMAAYRFAAADADSYTYTYKI